MPRIHLETRISAPVERCFDLMRSVEAHVRSGESSGERAVAGKTSGLFDAGDWVTWEAVHFGVRQRLTVRITRCDRPWYFEDIMVRGAFAGFIHRHTFRADHGMTIMLDDFEYRSPLGPLGVLADRLFLEQYMRRLLRGRAAFVKREAEAGREA